MKARSAADQVRPVEQVTHRPAALARWWAMRVRIGTAGWSIPRDLAQRFPAKGSALERYAAAFDAVEINSSFHRPHRAATWARWAASVPKYFRFAAKLPKTITHLAKLVDCDESLDRFAGEVAGLGDKLGVLLVQLPPKLAFEQALAQSFFERLSSLALANIACEPRHPSWFEADADALLASLGVARVAADPSLSAVASRPGGASRLHYWRLHGSPVMYRSSYQDRLGHYAAEIARDAAAETWCMFDNTASSAATGDALALRGELADLD